MDHGRDYETRDQGPKKLSCKWNHEERGPLEQQQQQQQQQRRREREQVSVFLLNGNFKKTSE